MFIKGNFLYTPSRTELTIRENEYAHIEKGIITGFCKEVPQDNQEEVVDCGRDIIIPAFVDLHIHAPQYINRGLGFDEELLPWLEDYTFPAEKRFADPDFARRVYTAFVRRLKAEGTLCFSAFATIHKEATWQLMEIAEKEGLKAYIGKVNMDRNAPDYLLEDTDQSLADTEELILRCREELQRVRFIATPRFVPSTTEKLMTGLGRLCEKYDLPVQSHLSENRNEVAWVRELHPDLPSYTAVYDAFGLLRPQQTIMAHAIYLSAEERRLLKSKGIYLAHCAQSNANLSSGIMPLRRNLEEGLTCSIASDVAAGHTPAMNKQIALTIEVSKLYALEHEKEKALTIGEGLYLATKGPGRFYGCTGSFEKGYAFDALVIHLEDIEGLERTPFEKLQQYIYDGDDRNIVARYVNGKRL
ncbi:amidohydrolase family protein [uncultured Megasphaera sp.]|uniref:amidohydrolase family protein n=1 Tax=uncultured Megasphaera sp. TaxID=165188 RepID=UPI0025DAFB97|nr:amidohydrolase family protein [uncultured Megasphaera sp.]